MIWLLALVAWIACGVSAYGFMLAMFQREFPSIAEEMYVSDVRFCSMMGLLFGPIALVVAISQGDHKYGFRLY